MASAGPHRRYARVPLTIRSNAISGLLRAWIVVDESVSACLETPLESARKPSEPHKTSQSLSIYLPAQDGTYAPARPFWLSGLAVALMRTMPWNLPRFRAASLFFLIFELSALAAHAQPSHRKVEKLDEPLSRSVRAGDSDTKRVIIRTIANGLPSLTGTLKGQGPLGPSHSSKHQRADRAHTCSRTQGPHTASIRGVNLD